MSKSKKPDRWERYIKNMCDDCENGLWKEDVIDMLRKQHRWVENVIKKRQRLWEKKLAWVLKEETEVLRKARADECRYILAKLKARGK